VNGGRGPMREVADLAIRRHASHGDPYRIEHRVQVTSFGGSGTTALCDHLLAAGVELQPGPAQWPFKHRRTPPTADQVPDGFRVVYVVGDPRNAVLSLFRRGIQYGHYEALNERPPEAPTAERLRDLESFLAGDGDPFDLADHVHGWLHHPPGYEVLFARQEHMRAEWPKIADFVGLPSDHPALRGRTRSSDWSSRPEGVRARLQELYGPLAAQIEAMPPLQVV
jgi:hypothetical protein